MKILGPLSTFSADQLTDKISLEITALPSIDYCLGSLYQCQLEEQALCKEGCTSVEACRGSNGVSCLFLLASYHMGEMVVNN